MKLAGVVVTYNRKYELEKNIISIFSQTKLFDKLYIIDNNSDDGTYDYLKEKKYISNQMITYIKLDENIGGAGGFYAGIKTVINDGYDIVCLMDDDGRAYNNDTIEHLVSHAEHLLLAGKDMLMLNSLVIYDDSNLSFGLGGITTINEAIKKAHNNEIINLINPFNGTIISKKLVETIGYPNKDFFIRGDEVEYQKRAAMAGAYIATVVNSWYFHPTFELFSIKWLGRKIQVGICPPWKSYYQIRNYVYRRKMYDGLFAAIREYIFQNYCAWKCNPEYSLCKPFMRKGFHDGIRGLLGARIKPGQTEL